jgi:hypothetical protein
MTKHTATEATGRHGWPGHLWRGRIFSFQVGTDQLWLVAIFACFLFLTSLMPLIPNDFWWHLKIGEIIFQEKGIPSTNMFAWSVPAEHPYTYGAWLAALPILMVFWVNAHGAFVLGIFLIGAYLVGETLARLFRLPGAISWRDIRWLGFTGLAALLAMLVNPNSTHIFGYVFDLLTDQPSQELIQEWRSPTPSGVSNLVFFASISLLILGLAYSRYRPSLTENLLLTGLMWLAWTGQRYIVWYALVAAPVLAAVFAGLPVRLPRLRAKVNRLNLILAVVLFLPAALAQPWFVEKINLPEVYGEPVIRGSTVGPLLSMRNPVEAAAYLLENPGGRLFNEMGYGSYLIWALPGRSVFIDPRVELYPFEQWQDYTYISHGVRYNQLLEKYGADRILLDKELQPELAGVLASDPSWEKEYEDRRAQIWRRK